MGGGDGDVDGRRWWCGCLLSLVVVMLSLGSLLGGEEGRRGCAAWLPEAADVSDASEVEGEEEGGGGGGGCGGGGRGGGGGGGEKKSDILFFLQHSSPSSPTLYIYKTKKQKRKGGGKKGKKKSVLLILQCELNLYLVSACPLHIFFFL